MTRTLLLIAGFLVLTLPARAQVIINPAALDQLAGIAPPVITAPPIRQAPRKVAYHRRLARRIAPPRLALAVSARPAPVPVVAAKPVAVPAVTRPIVPPSATIDFSSGGSELPGNVAAALQPFCRHPSGIITIDAYAAADPSDPSSAARLSMSRAFAIRDALTACGVASGDIIPRANGAAKSKTPDAAEITAQP